MRADSEGTFAFIGMGPMGTPRLVYDGVEPVGVNSALGPVAGGRRPRTDLSGRGGVGAKRLEGTVYAEGARVVVICGEVFPTVHE